MLTVVIKNDGEDNVVELTYQNLWKELKDIPGAELIVSENWFDYLAKTKNKYICFVEADCLVSSGYFTSMMGLFQKNKFFRKLAMLSSATAVTDWANMFYGYGIESAWSGPTETAPKVQTKNTFIQPVKMKKSTAVYPVEIGYVPGSIVRVHALRNAMKDIQPDTTNLTHLSEQFSITFWQQGDGNRVHLNPTSTYLTTEEYVNDISRISMDLKNLPLMWQKESI